MLKVGQRIRLIREGGYASDLIGQSATVIADETVLSPGRAKMLAAGLSHLIPHVRRTWVDVIEGAVPDQDPVNAPAHYNAGGIECVDAIRAALTPEEFRGFCKGSVLSYVWRERHKGGDTDLKKAAWYLSRLIGGES